MTDSPIKLARCPCGAVPEWLDIWPADGGARAYVNGSCCRKWKIEFEAHYESWDSPECIALAAQAWNDAPRGK